MECSFSQWNWQWVGQSYDDIYLMIGHRFTLNGYFDIRLSHTKIVLGKIIEIRVFDGGHTGNIEGSLVKQFAEVLMEGHLHFNKFDGVRWNGSFEFHRFDTFALLSGV